MAWQGAINSTTNFDTIPQNENQGIYILSNKLTKDVKSKFQMFTTKLNFMVCERCNESNNFKN
jgi:hypothetical protein